MRKSSPGHTGESPAERPTSGGLGSLLADGAVPSDTAAETAQAAEAPLPHYKNSVRWQTIARWLPAVLVLAWLWGRLVEGLGLVWSLNPQYAYGWAVPALCAYLAWLRWDQAKQQRTLPHLHQATHPTTEGKPSRPRSSLRPWPHGRTLAVALLLAVSYAGARLLQEANPWWSLAHWWLALTVVGTTLWFLAGASHLGRSLQDRNVHGVTWRQFLFPVAFILVAVPWPYSLTEPTVQALSRWNTVLTMEVLAWVGIPAVQHGNVIELARGRVGVDEACSGIRSLQGTLMLSLFFGELYTLSRPRRIALVILGMGLALAGNLGRTLLLTLVAAHQGEEAIAAWHDPAGLTILLLCCVGVWWAARHQGRAQKSLAVRPPSPQKQTAPSVQSPAVGLGAEVATATPFNLRGGYRRWTAVTIAWLVWLGVVEVGVARWYRWVDHRQRPGPNWELLWPTDQPGLSELEMPRAARQLLQYDEARQIRWTHPDGSVWQLSLIRWRPGRAAGYLAKSHSPLVCMPAAGYPVDGVSPLRFLQKGELQLPYRLYRFRTETGPVHVLYSRWDEGTAEQSFAHEVAGPWSRLSSVWLGRGTKGQRVLLLAMWGEADPEQAESRLREELFSRLQVKPLVPPSTFTPLHRPGPSVDSQSQLPEARAWPLDRRLDRA